MSTIREMITDANTIAIFSHIYPDADAFGSAFGMKNIIRNNHNDEKFVDVFIDGIDEDSDSFYDPLLRNEGCNREPYKNYDLAIILDCPNPTRCGRYQDLFNSIEKKINIDHHASNTRFGDLNFVSTQVSSTCELLYLLAKNLCKYDLNNTIAKSLYQGILTDTNCFTANTISPLTHQVVSELLKYKFNEKAIKDYYFKNNSVAKTKLTKIFYNKLKFLNKGTFTITKILASDFEKCRATFNDTLGLVDKGLETEGVQLTALLIEKAPANIYVSLRSKGSINVGEIATAFGGGGSNTIAAFQSCETLDNFEKLFIDYIKEEIKNLPKDDENILF